MYGRIERFEGTDANRLDASDDEQRRRIVGKHRRVQPVEDTPDPPAGLSRGAAHVFEADDRETDAER